MRISSRERFLLSGCILRLAASSRILPLMRGSLGRELRRFAAHSREALLQTREKQNIGRTEAKQKQHGGGSLLGSGFCLVDALFASQPPVVYFL